MTAVNAPLILGPSLGTSSRVWSSAEALLARERRVLSIDFPGHGAGAARTDPFSVFDLADKVIAAADDAGITRFHYAGISLGGAVGLALALNHADRLHSLTVICSAGRIASSEAWRERAATVRAQGTPVLVGPSAERWFAPGFIAANPDAVSALLHDLSDADDESYALLCEALAEFDVLDDLPRVRIPTLILAGEHDGVVTPDHARATAALIRGAAFDVVSGAGHLAPIEKPEAVAASLQSFIGGIS